MVKTLNKVDNDDDNNCDNENDSPSPTPKSDLLCLLESQISFFSTTADADPNTNTNTFYKHTWGRNDQGERKEVIVWMYFVSEMKQLDYFPNHPSMYVNVHALTDMKII